MSAWIKTSGAGTGFRAIIADPNRYGMFLGGMGCPDNTLATYDWTAKQTRCSTSGNLADNAWHHVAIVFRGGVVNGSTFYVDGIAKGSFTMTPALQAGSVTIGQNSGIQQFRGVIDDVRIYNRALSASEVQGLSLASLSTTIEASSGVANVLSAFSTSLDSSVPKATHTCPVLTTTLAPGNTDDSESGEVSQLQLFLTKHLNIREVIVTGYFGPLTESYVKQLQAKAGLEQVGRVGPLTRAYIASLCSR
jgi:peptidoglycan hydrolase-like protein with peptidoglycan-binding domain